MTDPPHPMPAASAPGSPTRAAHPPLAPGKFGVWVFLATEIMFFTGLIGSYIVLRSGSPAAGYSNLFAPGDARAADTTLRGLHIRKPVADPDKVLPLLEPLYREYPVWTRDRITAALKRGDLWTPGLDPKTWAELMRALRENQVSFDVQTARPQRWPRPYDAATNPLSIDLTALNTFILIVSSVTMVLALSAIQRNQKARCSLYLLATLLVGGTFLGIQIYEYRELLFERTFPIGISPTTHFTPDVSLFASCFFTMTGFHGAHVACGLIAVLLVLLRSVFGGYSRESHAPVEYVGLYWHFVDLVWILLFTVVYLI
jgi:heme/copper-type cytochrome/quinol oxidase subunit 3